MFYIVVLFKSLRKAHGSLVKGSRRCPLTAESAVRFRYELFAKNRKHYVYGFFVSETLQYFTAFIGPAQPIR